MDPSNRNNSSYLSNSSPFYTSKTIMWETQHTPPKVAPSLALPTWHLFDIPIQHAFSTLPVWHARIRINPYRMYSASCVFSIYIEYSCSCCTVSWNALKYAATWAKKTHTNTILHVKLLAITIILPWYFPDKRSHSQDSSTELVGTGFVLTRVLSFSKPY